jgi:trehalose-6-phosphate synthase
MSQQDRLARWRHMIELIRNRDVSWWAATFLKELATQRRKRHEVLAEHN